MVVLYFFPIFIVIAVVAGPVARGGASQHKPNRVQIVLGLLSVVALAVLAFWLTGMSR
jgi:hypothetical protein